MCVLMFQIKIFHRKYIIKDDTLPCGSWDCRLTFNQPDRKKTVLVFEHFPKSTVWIYIISYLQLFHSLLWANISNNRTYIRVIKVPCHSQGLRPWCPYWIRLPSSQICCQRPVQCLKVQWGVHSASEGGHFR